ALTKSCKASADFRTMLLRKDRSPMARSYAVNSINIENWMMLLWHTSILCSYEQQAARESSPCLRASEPWYGRCFSHPEPRTQYDSPGVLSTRTQAFI